VIAIDPVWITGFHSSPDLNPIENIKDIVTEDGKKLTSEQHRGTKERYKGNLAISHDRTVRTTDRVNLTTYMVFSQIIPVRITSRISRFQEHDQSIFSNRRNLVTVPLTKHTTNTNKSQEKPNDNSQFVPTQLLSNTMSLAPKIDEIAFTIRQKDIQVGFFTEICLKDSIADDPISISGYQLFRLDRKNKQHGGVCLYA
jgi:hypothetical protein